MNKPYIHGMLPDVAACAEAKRPAADQPQIRYLGDMQRLQPQPGDVFVLTCERPIDTATAERIKAQLSGQLGGATVLMLGDGLKLEVVAAPRVGVDLAAGPSQAAMVDRERVVHNFTIGDVATVEHVLAAAHRSQRYAPNT
ncbi:hypothetical protein [Variovorax paradoxus]|uniref:Uncharacterized protein n=1 Tax=Variovorax paradoxus TaxID=34073 RepID=A0A679J4E7_VARPD|nr:hypothetical protein VVAX_03550 [Variovorax paradoxus]